MQTSSRQHTTICSDEGVFKCSDMPGVGPNRGGNAGDLCSTRLPASSLGGCSVRRRAAGDLHRQSGTGPADTAIVERLLEHGYLIPAADGFLPDCPQTLLANSNLGDIYAYTR